MLDRIRDDRGSAVVEFSLIAVLLVFLLLAVLQVAALFYVRSVTAAAAADGARYGANADVDPAGAGARATDLIAHGIGRSMANRLPCTGETVTDPSSGVVMSQVSCRGRIASLLLPIGAFVRVEITARSLKDEP